MQFVIPCLLGIEGLIVEELNAMDAQEVHAENGRVFFEGSPHMLARANIRSRFAERVQIVVGGFSAKTFEELFQGTKALPWEEWIDRRDAFPVKGYCLRSQLFSVRDCQSIIKKAVVEHLRPCYGLERFEESGPIHQIQFSVFKDRVLLTLDTSGAGLHKRGYRTKAGDAPLKETIAAALCRVARLKFFHTLYDPLCGSGTILIEGARMLRGICSVERPFAAERWAQIPGNIWKEERELAKTLTVSIPEFQAFGSDHDPAMIEIAQENAERAGVADCVFFHTEELKDFSPKSSGGTLITNPPYGERLLDDAAADTLTQEMSRVFLAKKGWSYTVLSPDAAFEQHFGRSADTRRKLYNGMIQCQAYVYYRK